MQLVIVNINNGFIIDYLTPLDRPIPVMDNNRIEFLVRLPEEDGWARVEERNDQEMLELLGNLPEGLSLQVFYDEELHNPVDGGFVRPRIEEDDPLFDVHVVEFGRIADIEDFIRDDEEEDDEEEEEVENWGELPRGLEGEPGIMPLANFRNIRPMGARVVINLTKNEPEFWTFLLEQVKEVYGCNSCIAGGAIRDHLMNARPRDIDIFIDHNFPDLVVQSMVELNWGMAGPDFGGSGERDPNVKGSWILPPVRGYTINLIAKPIPKGNYTDELLKTFDFELCKSAFDLDRGLVDTPEALKDRVNKTCTYTNIDGRVDVSRKRFQRFITRPEYADFKLIGIPDIDPKAKKKVDGVIDEATLKYVWEQVKFKPNNVDQGWPVGREPVIQNVVGANQWVQLRNGRIEIVDDPNGM